MHNKDIEMIYKKYYLTVYKYLMCLTHNPDLSDELTQETFYKMIKKIDKFEGKSKISSWLCEIAKNLWYDELRKKKHSTNITEDFDIQSEENLENGYIDKEQTEIMYKKIAKLDEATKRVMFLRLNSEMSFKEIGEVLGKSETWARVTFYRGKQKVKEVEENEK